MSNARYHMLRRLGQGGMAEVFEAELTGELGFVRKVAIKRMLASAASDPSAAQRFLDEARIASHLHHANVVSVIDVGLLDGLPFQVLELVDGIDVHQLMQRAGGTLPLEVALAIVGDVAHALDHAHAALDTDGQPLGIVHRDVKPSNVLVSWSGDVKLSDFGIAVARDRAAKTEAGVVPGTLGFIAPEQRSRSQLDGRTDVFALGLTLHSILAGYSPLEDVEVEVRSLVGHAIPIDANIAPDIRALIEHAVAHAPADRPSAGELATKLGAALASRLTNDRRSFLREFLAAHGSRPAAKPGALDQLLGIDVVRTGEPGNADGVGRYQTVAAGVSPAAIDAGVPSGLRTVKLAPGHAPTEQPPSRRVVPIVMLLAALALTIGVATWQLRGGSAPLVPLDAAIVVVHASDASDDLVVVDPPMSDALVATEPDAVIAHDARVRSHPASDAAARAPALDAEAAVRTGYLRVVGDESLVGAFVFVDGHLAGSVPNPIAIGLGRHTVEVKRRDGSSVLSAKTVELEPFHTRANPLEPSW